MKNNRLKEVIKAKFKTIDKFSEKLEVSNSTVYSWVEGRRSPKREFANRILKLLGSKDITLIYPDLHK